MQKEAKSRIKINNLLQASGWRFFDDEKGSANIVLENNAKLTKNAVDQLGNDFDKTKDGFVDFLLLDEKSFPYLVLEAKSEDKDPLNGKEQARRYAQSLNVRFVILSNGNIHYFWDLERGNPQIITIFPTQESLKHFESFKPDPTKLADEKLTDDYIAFTQNPTYQKDPRWVDENKKLELIKEYDLKFLRPYQIKAIEALQDWARNSKDRYLFEMATGTGKTLTCAAVIKLFLKTGNAKRVLFLVDRIELEDQAAKNLKKWLSKDYITVIYKENKNDWRKAGSYPASPTDGQAVYEGNQETFTDTSLTNGTTYYYGVYSYDRAKSYSNGIQVSLAPTANNTQVTFDTTPQIAPDAAIDHFVQVFKKGNTDVEIQHLQEILSADAGVYPQQLITGYFGSLTEVALKRFQAKYNLPQTGITDTATQAKLNEIADSSVTLAAPQDLALFNQNLKYGDQNPNVEDLQQFLLYEGSYQAASIDGIYGTATVQAVKTFQQKYGIKPVSGYFGPKTQHKIKEITGL